MSKFNRNFVKSKIESIANKPRNKDKYKENELNISTKTLKDSYSYLDDFKENLTKGNIKKVETNIDWHRNNNISSLRTKDSSANISGINENLIKEINMEDNNELKEIYNDLLILFHDIKLNDLIVNKSKNLDNIKKLKILSFHFIKILFNENFKKIIKLFNDSIEINKFFLYQIYLILSVIYFNHEKLNEYLLLSYKTILIYSLQNFEVISQILENYSIFEEEKINKNIFILNKIILSLLKTLTNIPPNSQIIYFVSPIKNKSMSNESGLNNLLNLLKNNKDLTAKMKFIEDEEYKILQDIESSNQKILPDFESKKYKFSVFIELDETLVHYCEEGDNYFVQVRPGLENLFDFIKTFCEIIIVTTSSKEYSDIIIDSLNKNENIIKHRIYVEDNILLDLSKINRDMNKCIFISHEANFMKQPEENSIILKGFYGDENDKEFIKLEKEFKNIEKQQIKDIRINIKEIQGNINKEK